ncbi:MAG: hypothetical protein ACUVX8_11170 [Candidatus Zipacnadales bacterium]
MNTLRWRNMLTFSPKRLRNFLKGDKIAQVAVTVIIAWVDQVPSTKLAKEGTGFVVIVLTSLARHLGRKKAVEESV